MGLTGGQVLAGRYRLGRRIAIGGMGEVWQAADTRLDRPVAVKVLKPELSDDAEFRHRFHAEARMTASLNHPGIAAVHDYGEAASAPVVAYMVMELVAGDALDTILMRYPRLSIDRTLDILGQAGHALQAAHERGLVHRDIKPGNILITPEGRVKLTDFGIARAVDAIPVTRTGMVLGTAHYVAPEQAAGHDSGPASDVYSLGVVGYECLAGQRPFRADNAVTIAMMHIRDQPPPLPPDVPPSVRALIDAALVKDSRQRYGTGGEFAAAVTAVRAGDRLPLPNGLAANATLPWSSSTTPVGQPPTALLPLPPGGQPHAPQWAQRSTPRSGAARIAAVLLGAFGLVLGGYLARDALRSPIAPSGLASGAVPTGIGPAPFAPLTPPLVAPQPFQPEPTKTQPDPEPDTTGDTSSEVLIIPTDYWGSRGSDAAVTAKVHGLIPRVVDEDGDQIDPDLRSQCRIVDVDPQAGLVPRGSTVELTCRRRR